MKRHHFEKTVIPKIEIKSHPPSRPLALETGVRVRDSRDSCEAIQIHQVPMNLS